MKKDIAMVRSSGLADFARFSLTLGLDPIAFMRRAGIHRRYLSDPNLTLPVRAVVELLEDAALASGMEDFGLRLGEQRGLPDFGPVILMLREETTVRDALRTLIAFLHLHSDALYMHLDEDVRPILTIDLMVGGNEHFRQAIDTSVASTTGIVRWLLGGEWAPASVCFMHSRPASRVHFERFFRCPIDFLHECNGIVFRKHDLDKSLPASSPALRQQAAQYIRLTNVASNQTYVHRVTQVIAMALPRGEANAEIIAQYLGTGHRTLNRRLARAGLNYSRLLERARRHLASQYMLGSDRPLSDICGLIGFDSLSAFSRWFRQSFKVSPTRWRKVRQARKRRH
jgi:AraC-like DNA-binding protein